MHDAEHLAVFVLADLETVNVRGAALRVIDELYGGHDAEGAELCWCPTPARAKYLAPDCPPMQRGPRAEMLRHLADTVTSLTAPRPVRSR